VYGFRDHGFSDDHVFIFIGATQQQSCAHFNPIFCGRVFFHKKGPRLGAFGFFRLLTPCSIGVYGS
jgi:hypothetical protein